MITLKSTFLAVSYDFGLLQCCSQLSYRTNITEQGNKNMRETFYKVRSSVHRLSLRKRSTNFSTLHYKDTPRARTL